MYAYFGLKCVQNIKNWLIIWFLNNRKKKSWVCTFIPQFCIQFSVLFIRRKNVLKLSINHTNNFTLKKNLVKDLLRWTTYAIRRVKSKDHTYVEEPYMFFIPTTQSKSHQNMLYSHLSMSCCVINKSVKRQI